MLQSLEHPLVQEIRLGSPDCFSLWEGGVWGQDYRLSRALNSHALHVRLAFHTNETHNHMHCTIFSCIIHVLHSYTATRSLENVNTCNPVHCACTAKKKRMLWRPGMALFLRNCVIVGSNCNKWRFVAFEVSYIYASQRSEKYIYFDIYIFNIPHIFSNLTHSAPGSHSFSV